MRFIFIYRGEKIMKNTVIAMHIILKSREGLISNEDEAFNEEAYEMVLNMTNEVHSQIAGQMKSDLIDALY